MKDNVLILFSGGLDSTCCINYYSKLNCNIHLLFIDYNQKSYKNERKAVVDISNYFGLDFTEINISEFTYNLYGKSELVGRNLTFASIAINSFPFDTGKICLGLHMSDYLDSKEDFCNELSKLIFYLSRNSISLEVPFIKKTKQYVYDYSINNFLPINLTYSCEEIEKVVDCQCNSCIELEYLKNNKMDLKQQRNLDEKLFENYFPLLLYSFSSKGFPLFDESLEMLDVPSTKLLSLYDLHYSEKLKSVISNINTESIVYWDSGIYEKDIEKFVNTDNPLNSFYQPQTWNKKLYIDSIKLLKDTIHNKVIVSYDKFDKDESFENYLENVKSIFSNFDFEFKKCYLIRLSKNYDNELTQLKTFIEKNKEEVDIIGITQKDLGVEPKQQLRNLFNIRNSLKNSNKYIPIHIFGCLTPKEIFMFYMCGADIFDGLAWQKYYFQEFNVSYKTDFFYDNEEIEIESEEQFDKLLKTANIRTLEDIREQIYTVGKYENFEFAGDLEKIYSQLKKYLSNGWK